MASMDVRTTTEAQTQGPLCPPILLNLPIYTGTQLTCGEVMGLRCEDNMSKPLLLPEAAWLRRVLRL